MREPRRCTSSEEQALTDVVVVGAGGFGREVLDVIEAANAAGAGLRVLGVVDDAPSDVNLDRLVARGYVHLGPIDTVVAGSVGAYVLGVGGPAAKRAIAELFDSAGWTPVTVVHPAAVVSPTARIGAGSIVCGGVQLSTNSELGRHVHLNPNTTIGHDAVVGNFASVNPGAIVSGEVRVGDGTLIGAGAVVLQGLDVGAGAVVGASACVTRPVAARATVVGVPARSRS